MVLDIDIMVLEIMVLDIMDLDILYLFPARQSWLGGHAG
jgi:hypothetical protein